MHIYVYARSSAFAVSTVPRRCCPEGVHLPPGEPPSGMALNDNHRGVPGEDGIDSSQEAGYPVQLRGTRCGLQGRTVHSRVNMTQNIRTIEG